MDPYPNIRKREEIAAACNKAYESMDGGKHGLTCRVMSEGPCRFSCRQIRSAQGARQ